MFTNRQQAGELLSAKLSQFKGEDVVVLGIPRGGMVVAKEVAKALKVPLDAIVIRKITLPENPELAIGAVGPGNTVYWDKKLCESLRVDKRAKTEALRIKNEERRQRERLLRRGGSHEMITGKNVILVDDGVATGATSIAAGMFIKKMRAKKSILASPVVAYDTLSIIKRYFNTVIYLDASSEFHAVGQFYEDFPQVNDEEVVTILRKST